MSAAKEHMEGLAEWSRKMFEAYATMSGQDRQELHDWERTHLDRPAARTSDWPGWERIIGKQSDWGSSAREKYRGERLHKIIADPTRLAADGTPRLVIQVIPHKWYDPATRIDLSSIKIDTERMRPMRADSWSALQYDFDNVYVTARANNTVFSYTQLFDNGIGEAVDSSLLRARDEHIILSLTFESEVFEAVLKIRALQKNLGFEPPLYVMLSLLGVKGYTMGVDPEKHFDEGHPIYQDDLLVPEAAIENFDDDIDRVMHPVFNAVWRATGRKGSHNFDETGRWTARHGRVL